MRWCFSGGQISPPPPSDRERKFPLNPCTSNTNDLPSCSDEDQRRFPQMAFLRVAEKLNSMASKISNRPLLAPKPKFDDWEEMRASQRFQKSSHVENNNRNCDSIPWRLQKIGLVIF
ncbi:unnamed protein product [Thelazia callipaeda]|uniref:Uncharacterized protein n=1 Tax=Thelazia callipaeda TaxID=103827 RepID=A0A0N5CST7_THECL|nr:unnamed protein product [Thelazia callipaeda]